MGLEPSPYVLVSRKDIDMKGLLKEKLKHNPTTKSLKLQFA